MEKYECCDRTHRWKRKGDGWNEEDTDDRVRGNLAERMLVTKLGKVFPSSSQAEETGGEEATETAQEKSEKPSNLDKANALVEEANKKLDEIERGDEPVKGEGELLLFIEQEVFPIGQREAAVEERLYEAMSAFEMNGDKEAAFETVDRAMKEYEPSLRMRKMSGPTWMNRNRSRKN